MHARPQVLIGLVVLVGIPGMVVLVTFHLGEVFALRVGQFAPLLGAFIGGGLVLITVTLPTATTGALAWKGRERTSWLLMGFGILAWGIGEAIWRSSVSPGRSAFPSFADSGYALFPLLAMVSLLVKPSCDAKSRWMALLMDSFILTGALWSIAWYHVVGNLAQTMSGMSLAKILVLYYPASDTILLSSSLFLLFHEQEDTYRSLRGRMSQLVVGLGLSFFVVSDFLFHSQQHVGMSVESPWIDLGRFLGLITIGIAAYVGRFPLERGERHQKRPEEDLRNHLLSPLQIIPYGLLVWLFIVVIRNIVATDSLQQAIHPVLLLSALTVFGLVMVRQIVTIRENRRVAQQQAKALEQLIQATRHMEEQAHQTAEQQTDLERGIEHLRNVQASLANGDLHARATLTPGALWPLAANLNLMAERLARTSQDTQYAQRLVKTLAELSVAIDRGMPFDIPASCYDFPEISQLVAALRRSEGVFYLCWLRGIPVLKPGNKPSCEHLLTACLLDKWRGKGTGSAIFHACFGTDILRSQVTVSLCQGAPGLNLCDQKTSTFLGQRHSPFLFSLSHKGPLFILTLKPIKPMRCSVQQEQILLPGGITVRDPQGNHYIIEGLLGTGRFGAVYLVSDRSIKQNLFALKEVIDPNKRDRERFIFEGEVLKRLEHRALPRVYRVFEHDKLKRVYLLMDYIKGRNLEALRKEQPDQRFALPLVLAFLAPIVDALIYLHRQDPPIVHRDIKPANIIVPLGAEEAVLVDFGSAKEYVPDADTTPLRHRSAGYAALEQYGSGTTPRTDIYGVGATFYTLLTGTIPPDAISRVMRSRSTGSDPLKPTHLLAPAVPTAVAQAIQRAMSISSDDRYETVEEFWQVLTDHATQQQTHIPQVTSADMPQALPEQGTARTMPATRRWILLPIFFTLLVTLALGTGFLSHMWGLTILLLLCMGILLLLLLPLLHRQ